MQPHFGEPWDVHGLSGLVRVLVLVPIPVLVLAGSLLL